MNPFQYSNTIKSPIESFIPYNRVTSSFTSNDSSNEASTSKSSEQRVDINDTTMGEYTLGQTFCLTELPLSPISFGRSLIMKQQFKSSPLTIFNTFISGGTLTNESNNKNAEHFLYKEKILEIVTYESIPPELYGKGYEILAKIGYKGNGLVGFQREGVLQPILKNPIYQRDTTSLGYREDQINDIKGKEKITSDFLTKIWEGQLDSDDDESNDYEWDEMSFMVEDKEIDVIWTYSKTYHEGTSSWLDSLELIPFYANRDNHEESEVYPEQVTLDESMEIDLVDTFLHLEHFSINTIMTFEHDPNDPLPLLYPKLIDWDSPPIPELDVFYDDDSIIDYLGIRDYLPLGDHKAGFLIELNDMAYFGECATPFSHKNNKLI